MHAQETRPNMHTIRLHEIAPVFIHLCPSSYLLLYTGVGNEEMTKTLQDTLIPSPFLLL